MQDDDAYAAAGLTVVERDGEMMRLQIETDKGSVMIVAEFYPGGKAADH